jgi:two-component system OmpR family response regulator
MRILLVEDEPKLASAVAEHLRAENHSIDCVDTLDTAISAQLTTNYQLILLDLQLPDGNGLTFLNKLRAKRIKTPVIIMTAKDKISERIRGLNAGADDYVIKPFDLNELVARINTVIRRTSDRIDFIYKKGLLKIDTIARKIELDGHAVRLTAKEWAIFDRLIVRSGAIVSRADLETTIYEFGQEIESNSIEAHISRIRNKLGKSSIVTHRGIGYSLDE